MNNKNLKNFIKSLKNISLSQKEKDVLRYRISEFISYHPIRNNISIRKKSFYFSIFTFRTLSKGLALVLVFVTIVGGTGVSYASTSALPGDRLYSVKVNVTERIEERLAVSPESKVNVQSAHVERRLNEAQRLVQENRLSPQTKEIVRTNLERNVQNVTRTIENLKNEGQIEKALDVAARVTPVLSAHKEVLAEKVITKTTSEAISSEIKEGDDTPIMATSFSLESEEGNLTFEQSSTIASEKSEIESLLESVSSAIEKIEKVEEVIIEKILENETNAGSLTQNNKDTTDRKIREMRGPQPEIQAQVMTERVLNEAENLKPINETGKDAQKIIATTLQEEIKSEDVKKEPENELEKKILEVEVMLKKAEEERLAGNIRNAFVLSYRARKITEQIRIQQKITGGQQAQIAPKNTQTQQESSQPKLETSTENTNTPNETIIIPEATPAETRQEIDIIKEIEQVKNLNELTEKDVLESIEKVNESLKKINQANLEAQNRL